MSFSERLNTDNTLVELVAPDIERDAPASLGWVEGEMGMKTLGLMGVPDSKIQESTLEVEKERIKDFIESDKQLNWMISYDGNIVGSIWVDSELHNSVQPPSIHIMIGTIDVRGKGIGLSASKAVIDYLHDIKKYQTIYSRHLSSNEGARVLLEHLGFKSDGNSYTDQDGLNWQNVRLDF